ncbi:NUDIX hydrolase [Streptomyces sp. MJM8645]|uniref:NUDIX domain-containing protein n=1 Tax=Streptomycetaceae TaxID=2062 RepID=UPI0007AF8297|nr:NUDIX hydrolase [Streptomyces sp. MJM8645]
MADSTIPPRPPRRRIGVLVLIRNQDGHALLVRPRYREDHTLPGGGVHPGEQLVDAAAREIAEEVGLKRMITHALAIDQIPANPDSGAAEELNIVLDGGVMTTAQAGALSLPVRAAEEIAEFRWVPVDELHRHTLPFMERRIRQAVAAALVGIRLPLLYIGSPADERHAA